MGNGSVLRTSIAAASQRGGVGRQLAGEIGAGENVVGHDVGQLFEPEQRNLGEDLSLVRNGRGQHDVEGRETVGGDNQQLVAELVDVANFAAPAKFQSWKIGL